MKRFGFTLWWACRERPFFAAAQSFVVQAICEADALAVALAKMPDGPFLHAHYGCCYISTFQRWLV